MSLSLVDWHLTDAPPSALKEHRHLREEVFFAEAQGRDFVGVQAYTRHRVNVAGFMDHPEGAELTAMGYEYWPGALEATIRVAAEETRLPVFVTENGIATEDDSRRIDFIRGSLEGVFRCSSDGIDVLGYCYWSALDNFEWEHGYGPRFGLIEVDRLAFGRRAKPSAVWLGEVARRNALRA
jgi:beta-glucosidase